MLAPSKYCGGRLPHALARVSAWFSERPPSDRWQPPHAPRTACLRRPRGLLPQLAAPLAPDAGGDFELPLIADHELVVARLADGLEVSQDVVRQGPFPDIAFARVPEIDATGVVDRAGIGVTGEVIGDRLLLGGGKHVHPLSEVQLARRLMYLARQRLAGPEIEAGYPRQGHEGVAVLSQEWHQPLVILRQFLLHVNSL